MSKYIVKELGFFPPPYGGVSTHILRLVSKLNADGISAGAYYTKSAPNIEGVSSDLFHRWKGFSTKKIFYRFFLVCNQLFPYHIIHSHMSLEAMPYLWGLSVFCRKNIIITIHNSMVDEYYKHTNFINQFFLRRMAKRDVVWIAVSEEAKMKMEQLPFNFAKKILVIPAYIPLPLNNNLSLPKPLETFISQSDKIITFYGHSFMKSNGNDIYGFYAVLDMFRELVDLGNKTAKLVYCIADTSEIEDIENVKNYAKQKDINDRIFWQIGPITNMQALWLQTDVYVRPTCTDGDSLAVREALDLGLKVVASDVCQRPSGVSTYNYGNSKQFAKMVIENLDTPKESIKQNFSYYQHLVDIYKQFF